MLVEGMRLSGVGALGRQHLYFTTPDALYRVPRAGGDVQELVSGEAPALLGVLDDAVVFTLGGFFSPTNEVFVLCEGQPPKRVDVPAVPPGCVRLAGRRLLTLDSDHTLVATSLDASARERLADFRSLHYYAPGPRPFLKADDIHGVSRSAESNGRYVSGRGSDRRTRTLSGGGDRRPP